MRFQRPCLDCGTLSLGNRCDSCLENYKAKETKRLSALPKLRDKSLYYNSDYRKQSKLIRESATHCYLCGKPLEVRDGKLIVQVDHVFPTLGTASPLLPSHPQCNRSKGNKDFSKEDFPNSTFRGSLPNQRQK